jgi:hypothetical protein
VALKITIPPPEIGFPTEYVVASTGVPSVDSKPPEKEK